MRWRYLVLFITVVIISALSLFTNWPKCTTQMVLKGDKEDAARAFLAYLQTDAAMTVFESVGFSPAI